MTENAIKQCLLSQYNIESVEKIEKINVGVENQNYKIFTPKAVYVYRVYAMEHSIKGLRTSEDIATELEFMRRAKVAGVLVPKTIALSNGELYGLNVTTGNFYSLFELIDNSVVASEFKEKTITDLSEQLQRLFDVSCEYESFGSTNMSLSVENRMLKKYLQLQTSGKKIPVDVERMYKQAQEDMKGLEKILRKGLIHGDIKLENILTRNDGRIAAILDFDDCRYSYVLEDIVMALLHNIHEVKSNMIRAGYFATFTESFKNQNIKEEIKKGLETLIRIRLVYDFCKLLIKDDTVLVNELLADLELKKFY